MVNCKRILIIKWGALGDLIAGTTAVRALRLAYPNSYITLLSNKMMHEISPAGSFVDKITDYDPRNINLKYHIKLITQLRKEKFDTAINLRWTSERSAWLCRLSGAKHRAGSGPKGLRYLYNFKAPLYTSRRHEFDRHLDIVGALGIPLKEPEPFIIIDNLANDFANSFFCQYGMNKSNTIVLHPGASILTKAWLPERFSDIGKMFIKQFHGKVLVTWGANEDHLAERIATEIGDGAIVSPPTTIRMFAALVSLAGLCVVNYSGAMNVAMAVKTPLVAIGCTSPEDWGPYGSIHRTISSFDKTDVYTDQERLEAMNKIKVDDVWDLVSNRWAELYTSSKMN